MLSLNKLLLAGNCTRDPECRYTPKGTAVCEFGVAVNRRWTSESGEKKEEVTFVECKAWNKSAEMIAQYFKKGSPIFIEGRLTQEAWEDKNSKEKKSRTRVLVENFQFVGSKRESGPAVEKPVNAPAEKAEAAPVEKGDGEDSSVPF